ncbi:MAG: type III pantothenate kinase [Gammaproteobacteria bacterium]|nr:type III pantothenate kinase [Gammaproteobacteria bacterium]
MNLLIDLGNSRLKWAQQAPGLWRTAVVALDDAMPSLLDRTWRDLETPRKVVMCSVANPTRRQVIEQWVQARWSLAPQIIRTQAEQLGVKNLYRQPEQLGTDRWVALIGARGLTSGAACVVDCGTAVTVDALSAQGEFLGGVVFPGLRLLRESLVRGTAGISAATGNAADCLARSTADGVAAGTLHGLAGAVERLIEEYRRALGEKMQVLLTGGDAPELAALLRVPHTPVPDLVLKGLARIAESL